MTVQSMVRASIPSDENMSFFVSTTYLPRKHAAISTTSKRDNMNIILFMIDMKNEEIKSPVVNSIRMLTPQQKNRVLL